MQFHKLIFFILFFVGPFIPNISLAGNPEFSYDPATVELAGTLEVQTFPGPPNYESIVSGDGPERGFYLRLDHPINIVGNKNDRGGKEQNEKNVKILQLATSDQDGTWQQVHNAGMGAHVTVAGKLYHRLTGHHHSRVLIFVTQVR